MDFGVYLKKNIAGNARGYPVERLCMQCGRALENDGSTLYYHRFCSMLCKEKYVGRPLDY